MAVPAALLAGLVQAGGQIGGTLLGGLFDYLKNNPSDVRKLRKQIKNSPQNKELTKLLDIWSDKQSADYLNKKKSSGLKLSVLERGRLRGYEKRLKDAYKLYPELKKSKDFVADIRKRIESKQGELKQYGETASKNPLVEAHQAQQGGNQGAAGNGTYERFSPEQITAQQNSLNRSERILNRNPESFAPIANEYRQQFSRSIPELMKRFGEGGARSSDYFHALTSGLADFESKLAAAQAERDLGYREHALRERALGLEPRYGAPIANINGGASQWGNLARGAGNLLGDVASEYVKNRGSNPNIIDATTEPSWTPPNLIEKYQAGMQPTSRDAAQAVYGTPNPLNTQFQNPLPQTSYEAARAVYPYSY